MIKTEPKAGIDVEIAEYTINQLIDEIISGIFVKKASGCRFFPVIYGILNIYIRLYLN